MRQLQQTWKGLLVALIATSSILIACQKDAKEPSVTSAAKAGGSVSAPPPAFVFTLPTFGVTCATEDADIENLENALTATYEFDASFTNKGLNDPGGNNSITVTVSPTSEAIIISPQQVEGTSGHFTISGLLAGQYTVQVYFRHAGSDNAQPVNVPLSFTLTVQTSEQCAGEPATQCTADGVTLTRSVTNVETDVKGIVTSLQANYIVTNCGGNNLSKLKLQGGLINKASLIGTPTATAGTNGGATNVAYKLSTSNGNNVLTWTFNLPAGASETFSVYYNVWGVGCGSPLSGAWSLKNGAGTAIGVSPADMSATQAGYLDRLYWNCL